MDTAKLLHLADLHLDAPLKCKSEALRRELREATFVALENAVSDALSMSVDAVLIAGDLLDGARLSIETETRLREQFDRLATNEIPVIIVSGNHDPSGTRLTRNVEWPSNIHVVGSPEPTRIEIGQLDGEGTGPSLVIVAAGHEHSAHAENIVSTFPIAEGSVPHVGLVHAMVSSPSSSREGLIHDRYAPCTPEDLKRTGYSYWALGHVHVPQQVPGTIAVYSGCLQGRHHKEGGPRGGYLVTINPDGASQFEFRNYAQLIWTEIVIDKVPDELVALEGKFERALANARSELPEVRLAVRLTLRGQSELFESFRDVDESESFGSRLAARFDLADVQIDASDLYAQLDMVKIQNEPTVVSEAIAIVEELVLELSKGTQVNLPDEILDSIADSAADIPTERWELLLKDLQFEAAQSLIDLPNYRSSTT